MEKSFDKLRLEMLKLLEKEDLENLLKEITDLSDYVSSIKVFALEKANESEDLTTGAKLVTDFLDKNLDYMNKDIENIKDLLEATNKSDSKTGVN